MTQSIKKFAAIATAVVTASLPLAIAVPAFAAGSNGSFEAGTNPGGFITLAAGDSTNITDWTVGGNGVDYIGSYWQSSEGVRNIDLNALAAGEISQTITTIPGAAYTVSFYLSGNPDGVSDTNHPYYSPSNKIVRVAATGVASEDFSFDTAVMANDKTNMKWELHTYAFVATGASTVLSFSSQIPGAFGPALDNVSITEALPACSTMTLVSAPQSTMFKGMTTTNPAGSSVDGLFTGGPAPAVVAGPDGFPGAWTPTGNDPALSTASWVNDTAAAPTNANGGQADAWRLFSQSFTLPVGAIVSSASVSFSADNSVTAYYDNAAIGSSASYLTVETSAFGASAGTHELEFVTKNDAYGGATNPTAVIYKATINFCMPVVLNCPAAPAVANRILKEKGIKPAATSNYISSVAKHMGPNTTFNGVNKCDTVAYRAAVYSYLDTQVNAF